MTWVSIQATDPTFKSRSPPLFLGSSDEKRDDVVDTGDFVIRSPSPGPKVGVVATADLGMEFGAEHDNLEEIYAGIDSMVDTTKGHAGDAIIDEDDPLAEFEAWIASGAVQIVDKL